MLLDYIIYIVFSGLILYLFLSNIKLRKMIQLMTVSVLQANIDKQIIENGVSISNDENFVKFLSQSRDDAYKYIEEVQTGIKDFINNVDDTISYYDQYGSASTGMFPPYDSAMQLFSAQVKNLKNLLPKEKDA
ncbi:MAG: hypothetical protein EBV27_00640 [Actinobacteria bacterium]|nr:hypothetical protein [Actinomycetota bacterium]